MQTLLLNKHKSQHSLVCYYKNKEHQIARFSYFFILTSKRLFFRTFVVLLIIDKKYKKQFLKFYMSFVYIDKFHYNKSYKRKFKSKQS